jgi:hypothetical protein
VRHRARQKGAAGGCPLCVYRPVTRELRAPAIAAGVPRH